MTSQGEVWWANLPKPVASEPGYRRPVVVVQADLFNRSRLQTVLCVILTSNLRLSEAPGNVYLTKTETGLPMDSVANVSQVATVSRTHLSERAGRLSPSHLAHVVNGIQMLLGR